MAACPAGSSLPPPSISTSISFRLPRLNLVWKVAMTRPSTRDRVMVTLLAWMVSSPVQRASGTDGNALHGPPTPGGTLGFGLPEAGTDGAALPDGAGCNAMPASPAAPGAPLLSAAPPLADAGRPFGEP